MPQQERLEPILLNKETYSYVYFKLKAKTDYFDHCDTIQYDTAFGSANGQIVLVKVRTFPKGKTLEVVAAVAPDGVANFQYVKDFVEAYARSNRCEHIMLDGRPGWRKVFPEYDLSSITLCKKL
jgi:hypothetical protein